MDKDELPRGLPDEHAMQVLASWRYAALFSFFVSVPLWLLAALWVWLRDNSFHEGFVVDMLVTWAFACVVMTLAIKWGSRRR